METGDIVYHDNLVFPDMVEDPKDNRPCVYLYSTNDGRHELVCSCVITSQVKQFNRDSQRYWLVPEVIYSQKKLSFAALDKIVFNDIDEAHYTGISLSRETTCRLIEKIIGCISTKEDLEKYEPALAELKRRLELYRVEASKEARGKKPKKNKLN